MNPEERYQAALLQLHDQPDIALSSLEALLQEDLPAATGHFALGLQGFLQRITQAPHPWAPESTEGTSEALSWQQPLRTRIELTLAEIYWQQGQPEAAFAHLRSALARQASPELYRLAARWQLEKQDYAGAISNLGQALQLSPGYLEAYEDLALLANLTGSPELAYRVISLAMPLGLTPRLFEELLLACGHQEFVPMRSLFLELCVQNVRSETRPLLVPLLRQLYSEADYHHAEYLGWHLLQVFPQEREIRNLYVLAALQQGHYAPALQGLLQAPEAYFRQAEHWFKLGVAYAHWQMFAFAQHAFERALALKPELAAEIAAQQLPAPVPSQKVTEVLKRLELDPAFGEALQQDPQACLASYSISWDADLAQVLTNLPGGPPVDHNSGTD